MKEIEKIEMVEIAGDFPAYKIGKYLVTQALWQEVIGNNPSHFKGENHPVENVSWDDIQDFLKKLNELTGKKYRLPTEAEWEFAARGNESYLYAGSDDIEKVAWYGGNSKRKTHPVGEKQANDFGLFDMSGNVWEWGQDGDEVLRMVRGGSWGSLNDYCRVDIRLWNDTYDLDYNIGFRRAV